MKMNELAAEYAAALFDLAKELSAEKEFAEALTSAEEEMSEEYILLLSSPNISARKKEELLEDAFGKYYPEYIVSFLKLLCRNKRLKLLSKCIAQYNMLYKKFLSQTNARIISAAPLTEAEKEAVIKKLEAFTDSEVTAEYEIDKSIIGGLIIYINGKIFDGSVRRKLHEVKDVIKK